MRNKRDEDSEKLLEKVSDRGGRSPFYLNLAAILNYLYFLFCSLQPNQKSLTCRSGLVLLTWHTPPYNAKLALVKPTISYRHIGATNTKKKIREMWLLVRSVCIFIIIGGDMSVPPIYWWQNAMPVPVILMVERYAKKCHYLK